MYTQSGTRVRCDHDAIGDPTGYLTWVGPGPADLAQREGANAEELKQSLKQIGRASVRATHTVNQSLSLARADGSSATRAPRARSRR